MHDPSDLHICVVSAQVPCAIPSPVVEVVADFEHAPQTPRVPIAAVPHNGFVTAERVVDALRQVSDDPVPEH